MRAFSSGVNIPGDLTVVNRDAFSSRTILARAGRDGAGSVLSFDGSNSSGAFAVSGDIDQYKRNKGGSSASPSLTIKNYASVTVSDRGR
jgi:hypothetical protein